MFLGGFDRMARRITQSADAIKLPSRRRLRATPSPKAAGPALVRGRGVARRRPRSPLSSLLAGLVYLLLGVAAALALMRLLP